MIAAFFAAPVGAVVVIGIVLLVVFSKVKSDVDDSYAANAVEAEKQNKVPVQPIGGNSGFEAGCMTIVLIICALGIAILVAGLLPAGVLLPK